MADISFDDLIPKNRDASQPTPTLSFDDLIPLAPDQGDGMALNTTAGLNSAIYSTLGAPVDLARGAINLGIRGMNAAAGTEAAPIPSNSFGGSESISRLMGSIGVPEPKDIQAVTSGERIARGAGEGVGYAIAPEAAIGTLSRSGALTGQIADTAARLFGQGASVGGVAANAVSGGAAGAGATGAMEAAPERWKPVAGLAGGMGGGFAGALAATSPQIARAAGRAVSDYAAPLTAAGRERLAADQLANAATDSYAVKAALADIPQEIVPGSQPTTFQLTGDMGLGGLERAAQTRRPEAFNQRRADQNSARLSSLEGVQPTGAPEKIAETARSYVRSIDDLSQKAFETASQRARESTDAIGVGVAPEVAGERLRASLEEGRAAAKEMERGLWSAVDPDGSLALGTGNTRQQVATTLRDLPKSAKPPEGEEAAIYSAAGSYGDVVPFSEVTALQSRVKTQLRAERLANGESPAYRRLSQLNTALQSDIEHAVAGKMQQQAQAVARGQMAPEDTILALMERKKQDWYAERSQTAGMGQSLSESAGANAPLGSSGVSAVSRGQQSPGGQFRGPTGNSGVQETGLLPNFDQAAAERLTAAQAATRGRLETFDNKTLAPIRKRPSTVSPYDMSAASIPVRIFSARLDSVQSIATLRNAVGDETALRNIEDYAVDRLRKVALNPDGTFDAAKLESWRKTHGDALKALPALDSRLKDAASASRTLAEVSRNSRSAADEVRQGRLGALMNLTDPSDVTRVVGSIFQRQDRMQEMAKLAGLASKDPEAKQGLRKAIVDHVSSRLVSNTEAGTSGQGTLKSDQFQTFVRENANALRVAGFSGDEVKTMQAIADDLQRANRSNTAVKLPGQSNTGQDAYKIQQSDAPATILGRIFMGAAATGGFASSGATGGLVGIVGAKAASAMREFGLETVNDILADAMLHPERARILLQKATPANQRAVSEIIARNYRKAATSAAVVSNSEQDKAK
jgi:hypothetical protein